MIYYMFCFTSDHFACKNHNDFKFEVYNGNGRFKYGMRLASFLLKILGSGP